MPGVPAATRSGAAAGALRIGRIVHCAAGEGRRDIRCRGCAPALPKFKALRPEHAGCTGVRIYAG